MPNPTVVNDPHSLSQGNIQQVSDLVFAAPTGDAVEITSAGSNIPVMIDKEFFEVRNHPLTSNNGLYQVDDAAPAAGTTDVRKVTGADPTVDAGARDCDILCALDTNVSDAVFASASGSTVDLTSVGGNLPTSLEIGSRFEVRNSTDVDDDGGFEVLSAVTDGFNCQKLTGNDPANQASEAIDIWSERKSVFYDTAGGGHAIVEQPGIVVTAVADAVWANAAAPLVDITSATVALPVVKIGQKVLVTDHATGANNGYYVIRGIPIVSGSWAAEMVSDGLTPADAAAEALNIQTDPLVDDTGALGQPIYSRAMIDWKDDNFLLDNSDFPIFNIDSDAGKYLIGQDASGNNSGINFIDNAEFGIRTRKLVRNMGWSEINSAGATTAQYAAIRSNATVEDGDRDLGFYQFGTDTTLDDTVDFEMAGVVDEAIKVFDALVTRADDYAIATNDTISRSDGGDFAADGYKVGGSVVIALAEDPANDGTHIITAIVAGVDGDLVIGAGGLTNNANDTTMTMDLDNRSAFSLKLRPRDDDSLGKTFAQQGLGNALATALSNRAFIFGLGTVEDANITVTDVTITGTSPWQDMTLTFHATPQARGAATLVGGSRNFGIIGDAATGTAREFYEFVQWSLRQLTDIDDDADTAIGRTIDGLLRFNGSVLEVGSVDGGLTFPTNPDGGGSGMYVDNLAAADANNINYFDNLGVLRANKETNALTLDFNDILIDDTIAEGTLYFDRTIRTTVGDLVITAGSPDTFNSAGANLPALDGGVNSFVRISSLTGGDAAMNGIYQVIAETSTTIWDVVRYDNTAIVSVASASVPVDEHPFNAPDSIVVDTVILIDAITISFTAPDTISDSGNGLGIFAIGDSVRIEGAGAGVNAGQIVKILTAAAGVLTIEQGQFDPTIVTQGAGSQVILTEVFRVDADADYSANFGFDDNVQGGRLISTETFVKAKALGRETAQYTASAVLSVVTQTPLTVPLQSQQERNVVL